MIAIFEKNFIFIFILFTCNFHQFHLCCKECLSSVVGKRCLWYQICCWMRNIFQRAYQHVHKQRPLSRSILFFWDPQHHYKAIRSDERQGEGELRWRKAKVECKYVYGGVWKKYWENKNLELKACALILIILILIQPPIT